jgi:hypothetical protein
MTEAGAAPERVVSGPGRLPRAWRGLSHERRQAAYASFGLFLSLFLPWYQHTVIAKGARTALEAKSFTVTGWSQFGFVEIVVLLVALGVLALLFRRGEGHRLPPPGGDGPAIIAAGSLAALLVVWGMFNQQGTSGPGQYLTASGIEWGIFVALAVALLLAYFGGRIRAVHEPDPDPPSPHDDGRGPFWGPSAPSPERTGVTRPATAAGAPRAGAPRADRPRTPRPVPADGHATRVSPPRAEDDPSATRVSRRERSADEQLTMPLEPDDDTRRAPE